ncbi:MAG: transporter substrate-binding domain-containing protein [Collinsella sp.]
MQPSYLLSSAFAASASVVAGALAGCQRPPRGSGPAHDGRRSRRPVRFRDRQGQDPHRHGGGLRPVQLAGLRSQQYTIPIDNVQGAYADGYDVQIAKIVCKALGGEPVAVKQSFSGLIDSLNNGQIDLIIAGMSATPEREESVGFPTRTSLATWPVRKRARPTKMRPSSATLAAQRSSAKRTPCSIPSSTRSRALSTRTRSIRSPRCFRTCCRAPATP